MWARLLRWQKFDRLLIGCFQACILLAATLAAFLVRFDLAVPWTHVGYIKYALIACLLVKPLTFHFFGLDRGWWRLVSIHDVARLVEANLVASLLFSLVLWRFAPPHLPRSIYVLDFLLALFSTTAVRVGTRLLADRRALWTASSDRRVLIYGAGRAGLTLAREFQGNSTLGCEVVGFVDDDASKRGLTIHGIQVLGAGAELAGLVERYRIREILIALPSATVQARRAVLHACEATQVPCRIVPALGELLSERGLADQIRPVAVEDLLSRTPVQLDLQNISSHLRGRTVLVTGAAGSIGSELCRQIARFEPMDLVALDAGESPLFHLEQQLRQAFPNLRLQACIGNVQDPRRLAEVFADFRPAVVYHAAAYKHVPLMESHVIEAVENNVFGTLNVLQSALQHGTRQFVLISTDKAVRPTNVMGATKCIAERMINAFQTPDAALVAVRFGNVLGSNGSVVPMFKEQIARAGPVTVTHPDMQRFFMTIPEACQLVLQASAMGSGGEIFVLEMGDPVYIRDLARNLILLSGKRPGVDIQIEYTGMRPGEKLCEELHGQGEDLQPTRHEKIRIFDAARAPAAPLREGLQLLRAACESRDRARVLRLLHELATEYTPAPAQAAAARAGSDA